MRIPDSLIVAGRGLRRRCPQCGEGRLFTGWYTPVEKCPVCGLSFTESDGFTLGFMYLSTAFLTGVIIVGMLIIGPPTDLWLGHILVLLTALALMFGSMPFRKGLAIAVDYFLSLRIDNYSNLELRRHDRDGEKR